MIVPFSLAVGASQTNNTTDSALWVHRVREGIGEEHGKWGIEDTGRRAS